MHKFNGKDNVTINEMSDIHVSNICTNEALTKRIPKKSIEEYLKGWEKMVSSAKKDNAVIMEDNYIGHLPHVTSKY